MPSLIAPVQLSHNLFVVYSEFPHIHSGNVYLITGAHPTLIDCGSRRAVPQIVDNLSQLGLKVSDLHQVIATHGDYDHVQGFHALRPMHPSLTMHIHRSDLAVVQGVDAYQTASYVYDRPFEQFEKVHCTPLDDGEILPAGDTSLVVHHTPGHTDGSVCLLGTIDGASILFAGDTIGGAMRSIDGADMAVWAHAALTWRQSLRRLSELPFEWVLNGHEPAASLPLGRAHVDRMMGSFGLMLNPWFSRGIETVPNDQPSPGDGDELPMPKGELEPA